MTKIGWLLSIWVMVLITGCGSPLTIVTEKPTEFSLSTKESTLSLTNTPTQQPSSTFTLTMTNTPPSKPTEPDGICLLPCWWGITPGVTTWEETLTNLKNMESQGVKTEEHLYSTESKLPSGLGHVWVYRRDDSKVYWIDISSDPVDGIQYYDLFTEYGEPSDIYLFTWKDFQTRDVWLGKGERPARVFFYYAGKGILAEYEFFGTLNDTTGIITICPKITEQKLKLDPSGTEYSQNDISHIFLGIDEIPILKIDDATSLTKHDFFMRYKDKNQTGCFETPVSLWQ